MSVVETYEIDGIAVDDGTLHLMISDHLDWEDEAVHLSLLQDKLNAYAHFYISKQYKKVCPKERVRSCCIHIYCMYELSEKGNSFIGTAREQLRKKHITIEVVFEGES